jgi:ATP-dependent helicase/nuclease subunit A
VILLRSPGSVGAHFQQALAKLGIRCSTGGGKDLLKSPEIVVLRSLLQTVANPRLDIPLISVLASPIFGFTADNLAEIRSGRRNLAVYDALKTSRSKKAEDFLAVLEQLRRTARMCRLTELLEQCLQLTRLDSICAAMEDGEVRSGNLLTFYQLAVDFESGSPRDLGQFLEHLDALEEKGLITAGSGSAGCVTIMSIHKSKGLEFPVVFLSCLSREFNRESTRAQILCDNELGLGLHVADLASRTRYPTQSKRAIAAKMTAESLSEELRVLYVAMTRARDRLIMTYAARDLEGDLKDIALRMDFDEGKLLCRDVVCPGEWVLLTAMHRTEAGELFNLGGRPAQTVVSEYPWKITAGEAPEVSGSACEAEQIIKMPEYALGKMAAALDFTYPHEAATQTPSKQTATQRKGRLKDAEAAEQAKEQKLPVRSWRKPKFMGDVVQGKEYGNAIHAVMQYIRYENCETREDVSREVARLVERGFLTVQQGQIANSAAIAAFFDSEIGRKLRGGVNHIREFKFSILDDASGYGDGLEGEQVLLQGVVDCALLEDDGITVIDFKTDYVTEETLCDVVERYRVQVQTYANALEQIFEQNVKAQYLYFFRLKRFVSVM